MSNSSLDRNTVGGHISSGILWLLIVAMLVFTSIRTIHLLQLTFPPDQQYVAYLGLAAFDVGVLGWFFYATQKARGASQRAVAYAMIFVCAAGVILATIADFMYQADKNGITHLPQQLVTVGIWGVIIVVCLNFLAGIIAHLVDPKHLQRMKEEALHDRIIASAHTHMDKMTDQIAPQIAERLALEWRDRITAELIGKLPEAKGTVQGSGRALPLSAPAPQPKPVSLAQTANVPAPGPAQPAVAPQPLQQTFTYQEMLNVLASYRDQVKSESAPPPPDPHTAPLNVPGNQQSQK